MQNDWYDLDAHLFDDVEKAADAALEEVLEEDRLLHHLEVPAGLDPRNPEA